MLQSPFALQTRKRSHEAATQSSSVSDALPQSAKDVNAGMETAPSIDQHSLGQDVKRFKLTAADPNITPKASVAPPAVMPEGPAKDNMLGIVAKWKADCARDNILMHRQALTYTPSKPPHAPFASYPSLPPSEQSATSSVDRAPSHIMPSLPPHLSLADRIGGRAYSPASDEDELDEDTWIARQLQHDQPQHDADRLNVFFNNQVIPDHASYDHYDPHEHYAIHDHYAVDEQRDDFSSDEETTNTTSSGLYTAPASVTSTGTYIPRVIEKTRLIIVAPNLVKPANRYEAVTAQSRIDALLLRDCVPFSDDDVIDESGRCFVPCGVPRTDRDAFIEYIYVVRLLSRELLKAHSL